MATLPAGSKPVRNRTPLPLAAALVAGIAAAGLILTTIGDRALAVGFVAAGLLIAGGLYTFRRLFASDASAEPVVDWAVAHALAAASDDALAVTDRAGRLVCANARYESLFGGFPTPPSLPVGDAALSALGAAGRAAWRDGSGRTDTLDVSGARVTASVERVNDEMLVWRFAGVQAVDLAQTVQTLIAGHTGDRLASAGVMTALVSPEGRVRAANRVLRLRAMGHEEAAIEGRDFTRFLITDSSGQVRFEREGTTGTPLRVLQIPFLDGEDAPMLVALLDEETSAVNSPAIGGSASAHVRSLISLLPLGMALVDRDGRFVHMNDAFVRATRVNAAAPPLYPGDLVVREDKAALADAVRRFAGGAAHATDMAIRLADAPEEPVAVSIAAARGLGEAAVLISLKDSGEEGKLKRQVAQATKMQAVGQLAGGVAHDFNNILTAIIGHCDLMLMRHSPGDSDYDDIQQIRANSNRAASLTRQLLAFSRQQTLRPQVLQLPDVISEVSNLLKRLLGETVRLEVKHGRNLGPVRADPGQLEQVVVNLAVNARDAMLAKNPSGGGMLTIETMTVTAADVRQMEEDVLPLADYTALRISDTGTGIPPDVLPKIFEPFFTTKEVGKGTGLGLSTVYGIIKQSGGFIFAESEPGQGTAFTIYLPVHAAAEASKAPAAPKEKPADLWGSGTVLVVEDEDMVRAVAERALTRQGYTVLTAENGEVALELLERCDKPDLLVSDVVMPSMDGPTMARRVRARYPDIPILFMSGYAEEQLRKSIDLDNIAFLPKPFSVQQLAEAARDVLATK
ncbi:response regulator [Sphingosinithalassobacter sp. LHW66-3]|uniref:hybrid sensor histidine kinase/response regulator n=1 Tax=Sphingosinithalassobacter sp. LHW66-3 TaxID=3424718 RepID=UPI003D6AAD9F